MPTRKNQRSSRKMKLRAEKKAKAARRKKEGSGPMVLFGKAIQFAMNQHQEKLAKEAEETKTAQDAQEANEFNQTSQGSERVYDSIVVSLPDDQRYDSSSTLEVDDTAVAQGPVTDEKLDFSSTKAAKFPTIKALKEAGPFMVAYRSGALPDAIHALAARATTPKQLARTLDGLEVSGVGRWSIYAMYATTRDWVRASPPAARAFLRQILFPRIHREIIATQKKQAIVPPFLRGAMHLYAVYHPGLFLEHFVVLPARGQITTTLPRVKGRIGGKKTTPTPNTNDNNAPTGTELVVATALAAALARPDMPITRAQIDTAIARLCALASDAAHAARPAESAQSAASDPAPGPDTAPVPTGSHLRSKPRTIVTISSDSDSSSSSPSCAASPEPQPQPQSPQSVVDTQRAIRSSSPKNITTSATALLHPAAARALMGGLLARRKQGPKGMPPPLQQQHQTTNKKEGDKVAATGSEDDSDSEEEEEENEEGLSLEMLDRVLGFYTAVSEVEGRSAVELYRYAAMFAEGCGRVREIEGEGARLRWITESCVWFGRWERGL